MKDENVFNAWLSKRLQHHRPDVYAYKVSDRFKGGVADFIIWASGTTVALETKYRKAWPSDDAKLLKHEFTSTQQNFLKNVSFTKNRCFGLVAVADRMYLFPHTDIPKDGNWVTGEFRARYEGSGMLKVNTDELLKRLFYGN